MWDYPYENTIAKTVPVSGVNRRKKWNLNEKNSRTANYLINNNETREYREEKRREKIRKCFFELPEHPKKLDI